MGNARTTIPRTGCDVAGILLCLLAPAAWSAPVIIEGTADPDLIDVSSSTTAHDIRGRSGDDRLTGSIVGDIIDGGYGYDRLQGGGGDDLLIGGPGNDIIAGGAGMDEARYSRSRSRFEITGGVLDFRVQALSDGTDGTDTLSGVEFLVFTDGRYSVSELLDPPASGDALRERIAAAPEGSWLRVNVNRYEEVWTPLAQRARVDGVPFGDPRKIIAAWSSMAWDANRRQLIIWGGGHANYAGNDVYRFDAATLRWQRASLPSAVQAPFGDRRYFTVDGALNAPISSHTYDNQEFLPLIDRFITFGGASYNAGRLFVLDDGVTKTGPYLWDPSRAGADMVGGITGSQVNPGVIGGRMWMNRNAITVNGSGASRPDSFINGTSAYVVEQDVESVLISEAPQNGGDLFRYRITSLENPALDRWELIGPGLGSYSDQGAGAYDPVRRVYLRTAKMGTAYGLVMWNVATPGPANHPIKFVPPNFNGQFVLSRLHGMDFDTRRSAFVLWNGDGKVWYLKPPASAPAFTPTGWTIAPAPVSGADAPALTSTTGVLGKWKYLRSDDVMMGLGHSHDGQVWVYKPTGWQAP